MQFTTVPGVSLTTTASGVAGNVTKGLGGLDSAWDIGDTLTANDKKLIGWDPSGGKINTAADMLSYYRHSGQLSGEVTSDFVDAIKTAIANGKGIPLNPAQLMSKGSSQPLLSSQTASALFSILNQDQPASA